METINIKSNKDLTLAEELIVKYQAELDAYKRRRIAGISVKARNEVIDGYENTIKQLKEKITEFNNRRNPVAKPVESKVK